MQLTGRGLPAVSIAIPDATYLHAGTITPRGAPAEVARTQVHLVDAPGQLDS